MIIAVIGKGGVGKTTVTALLLRRLIGAEQTPVLAVDADPSSCLGPVLGLVPQKTLGELRDALGDDAERSPSVSKAEWLALAAEEAITEQRGFDLLTMGHPEGPGCYCFVNTLLRDHLARLSRGYRHVLVDCEAGQGHLSRRTTRRPDALICVVNRSRQAAAAIARALSLFRSLHEQLPNRVELVLNGFETDEPLGREYAALASVPSLVFARVWTLPHDSALAAHDAGGRSLLDLSADTPAARALSGWEDGL